MACIFAPASGCSSARLEYTSGGRVVVGSNPIIPTNRFQVLVLLGLFLWVKIAVSKSRRSSSVALENILIAFASLGDREIRGPRVFPTNVGKLSRGRRCCPRTIPTHVGTLGDRDIRRCSSEFSSENYYREQRTTRSTGK